MRLHLIGAPRTGTTYFARVLRQMYAPETMGAHMEHDRTSRVAGNEPFRPDIEGVENVKQFLTDTLYALNNTSKVVMKSHTWHIDNLHNYGLMEVFKNIQCYNFVILRRSIWNTALSAAIAWQKKEYHDYKDFSTITIPEQDMVWGIEEYLKGTQSLVENKWDLDFKELVYYEDLTFNPRQDFANTVFCKRPVHTLRNISIPEHRFKSPDKRSTVSNYDEMYNFTVDYLKNADISWMDVQGTDISNIDIKTQF